MCVLLCLRDNDSFSLLSVVFIVIVIVLLLNNLISFTVHHQCVQLHEDFLHDLSLMLSKCQNIVIEVVVGW